LEDENEKEIDDLIEFAYELDYEKYMDDFEVRQALAIIKDRVQEIKKDDDWKNKITKEWNEAADEAGVAAEDYQGQQYMSIKDKKKQNMDDGERSVISYKSGKTGMSKQSLRS
jgi:hypothetical protein